MGAGCETGTDHARVCLAISDLSSATRTMMSVGYMPCVWKTEMFVQSARGVKEHDGNDGEGREEGRGGLTTSATMQPSVK